MDTVTAQDIERVKHQFGLDQPMAVQYAKWAFGMATANWGYSFFGGRPVATIVLERIPATLELMGSSFALALAIGVAIGVAITYYVVSAFFENMGNVSWLPAVLAAWSPDLLFGLAGAWLLLRTPT